MYPAKLFTDGLMQMCRVTKAIKQWNTVVRIKLRKDIGNCYYFILAYYNLHGLGDRTRLSKREKNRTS